MEITLIRHGKTAGNLRGAYVGRTDESLCEEGRDALLQRRTAKADMIFSSPMKRCVETVGILYPGQHPVLVEKLRECDFGRFEGKTWQELSGDPEYQAWIDSGGMAPFPEGESHEAFEKRCCEGFSEVYRQCREKGCQRAAIVAHGGTIMALLDAWSDPHRDYFDWQIKNGEDLTVTCVPDKDGGFRLLWQDIQLVDR